LKATVLEVVSTMKDLMRLNPLYKEHIQMFVQVSLLSKCNRLEDEEISLVEFNSQAVSLLHFWWLWVY
jgi:hypothetical protein